MGFINKVIDGLDTSKENYGKIKESLDLLVGLAEEKAVKFQNEVEDLLKIGRASRKQYKSLSSDYTCKEGYCAISVYFTEWNQQYHERDNRCSYFFV